MSFRFLPAFQATYKSVWVLLLLLAVLIVSNSAYSQQSDEHSIDFIKILQYAKLAESTYQTESVIRKQAYSKNYSLTHYGFIPGIGIAYFLITDDLAKKQILAVRGTSNIENAFVDVALKLTVDKYTGIPLHNGFSQAAQAIYAEIKSQLKTDYVIDTTGHSLGGAVAVILAMYMDVDKYKVGSVITFGQPKVTNVFGAGKFQYLDMTRVVTPRDLVPLVPFLDPVDINDIDIYWHLGREIVLQEGNVYSVLQGSGSMMRATKFTQEPLSEKNLVNHQMTLYLKMLETKISNAKQVPFKHSLNLFNLFGGDEK